MTDLPSKHLVIPFTTNIFCCVVNTLTWRLATNFPLTSNACPPAPRSECLVAVCSLALLKVDMYSLWYHRNVCTSVNLEPQLSPIHFHIDHPSTCYMQFPLIELPSIDNLENQHYYQKRSLSLVWLEKYALNFLLVYTHGISPLLLGKQLYHATVSVRIWNS